MKEQIAISNLTCGIICAKWALDLGYSQTRQLLFLIGGLFAGPFILLILYVYLIRKASSDGQSGGKII